MLELLAQLADMAFHYTFFHLLIEEAVDGIEYQRPVDPAHAVGGKIFQNAALPARQHQDLSENFGVTAVKIDFQMAKVRLPGCGANTAFDCAHSGNELTRVNWLANHVIGTH